MRSVAKICLTILLVVVAFNGKSQEESKWKDLSSLKGYEKMLLSVDFSDAMVDFLSVDEFKSKVSDWDEGVRDMQFRLTTAFNAMVFNGPNILRLVTQGDAPVTMNVKVLRLTSAHVSKTVTSMSAVVIISDKQGKELFRKNMYLEKGYFGSRMNLFGDVFERLGYDLGLKCIKFIR